MCLSRYLQSRRWNWEGDVIVHESVVPSHRLVPGRETRLIRGGYPMDVREFLVTENNALLRKKLHEEITPKTAAEADLFQARRGTAFDFRADTIARWIGENIAYRADGEDVWLFPDETLHMESGDCEDRAILLAALLVASGISAYNVRVALGRMRFHHDDGSCEDFDHAWVVYRREDGTWEIKEPVAPVQPRGANKKRPGGRVGRLCAAHIEYEPEFVFNGDHLWRVLGGRKREFPEVAMRSEWTRLDPKFAGKVHWTLIHDAIGGYGSDIVDKVRRGFTYAFGQYIDYPDMPQRYDPRDHFDNCCIESTWARVAEHLQVFRDEQDFDRFGRAAHAIGDFYAHTTYAHFARPAVLGGHPAVEVFDPAWLGATLDAHMGRPLRYDTGNLDLKKTFTQGPLWRQHGKNAADASVEWNGRLISGRYAHVHDSQSFFERFTWMPDEVYDGKDFWRCAAAPHHEEIAVDQHTGKNKLYGTTAFGQQFDRRYATAVFHVRQTFASIWGAIPGHAAPGPHPF